MWEIQEGVSARRSMDLSIRARRPVTLTRTDTLSSQKERPVKGASAEKLNVSSVAGTRRLFNTHGL